MGKGAGEVESLLQLAGGILVGGLALYRMSANQAKDSPVKQQRKRTQPAEQTKAKVVQKVVAQAAEEDDQVEFEWMSKKEPKTNARELVKAQSSWKSGLVAEDSEDEDVVPSWQSTYTEKKKIEKPQPVTVESKEVYSSESEEEEYVPSWMSSRNPQTQLDEVVTTRKTTVAKVVARTLSTSNAAISQIASGFSDVVFVYPGGARDYFGNELQANEEKNLFGHFVDVRKLETSAGAGAAVTGVSAGGSRTAVLMNSTTLKAMVPNLFEMVSQRLPAVMHVAAYTVGEELAIRQDVSEVTAVRDTGVVMLASGSAQEAHDFAIVSHVVANKVSMPLVHFFDGSRGLNQFSKIKTASHTVLTHVAEKHGASTSPTASFGYESASQGTDCPHVARVVEHTFHELANAFGRKYSLFEYSGPAHPEAVIIAMGTVAEVAATVLEQEQSRTVGVVTVRLLRPWSSAHLLEAIPSSVRRIAVLDQSGALSPLFVEVAAAFHTQTALATRTMTPLLLGGKVLPTSAGFTRSMVHSVVHNLLSDRPQPNFSVVPGANAVDQREMKQIVVFGSKASQHALQKAAHVISGQLANHGELNVQNLTTTDPFLGHGVVRSEIRLSPDHVVLPESYAVHDANVVLIEQSQLNAVGRSAVHTLRDNGTLVVIPGANDERNVVDVIPQEVRSQLARKQGQLVTLNVHSYLEKAIEKAGLENTDGLLETASLWIALAASLQIAKGEAMFQHLLVHLKNALRIAKPFQGESAFHLVNLVSHSLSHVDGYLTRIKDSHLLSGAMHAHDANLGTPLSSIYHTGSASNYGNNFDDFDIQSFAGDSITSATGHGLIGMSPIVSKTQHAFVDGFVPRFQVAKSKTHHGAVIGGEASADHQVAKINKQKLAMQLIFPDAYETEQKLKPSEHGVYQVRLMKKERLTPLEYDRDIFHLEFDISGTDLKYEIGQALGVYAQNDEADVDHFIKEYGLNPDAVVAIPARGEMQKGKTELVSVRNLLIQHLDLFGKPSKKFYGALAGYATRRFEHLRLAHTATDENEWYKLGVNEGVTYADLLLQFKSARPTIEQLVEIVPMIKPRHYSIASSMKLHPCSVHLLVVAVQWTTPLGRVKYGQCTRYLNSLEPEKGDVFVSVDVMSSVLRLPKDPKAPVIMAGLGTGLAPFKAFIEERKFLKEQGVEVGPMVLYFGARHRHEEYMYGEQLDAYEKEGLLQLRLAFSRDQPQKVYIQHLMQQDKALLGDYLSEKRKGMLSLCGPVWPVPYVRDAVGKALGKNGEVDVEAVEKLKEQGRYILEVY